MFLLWKIWKKANNINFLTFLFFGIGIIFASTTIIYSIERETFENSYLNAIWWTMTTVVTVGYGDISPQTSLGKIFTMAFVYPFGIGMIGLLIGKIAENVLLYFKLLEEGKLEYKDKNHYVLIGCTDKTKVTIDEILEYDKKAEIVLIDDLPKSPIDNKIVHYIQGDTSDENTLKKANIIHSKKVCIFSDDKLGSMAADAKTLLIASTVENLSKESGKDIYTVVEIMKEMNIKKFKYIDVDEFILSNDTVSNLMAQAMLHSGSSQFFRELTSKQTGENLYEIKKKNHWNTYKDAFHELIEQEAILVWDKSKKSINTMINEKIPEDSQLFIICSEKAYQSIIEQKNSSKSFNKEKSITHEEIKVTSHS